MKISLKELAEQLGAELIGDPLHVVDGCATLESAQANQLSFIYNKKYADSLKGTKAGVVILSSPFMLEYAGNALVVENPYLSYAKAATIISQAPETTGSVHVSAVVAENTSIAEGCVIGANVSIANNVRLQSGCHIGPGCVIHSDVVVGKNAKLVSNVVLAQGTIIGDNAIINSGAVIGSDGFGFAPKPNKEGWQKIPQLGCVVMGDDVEIGANTTIDRGALDNTIIGNGVKIDNQVMIAHNVIIGDHTAIAACVGIAGSTTIGKHCTFAGAVGVVGHINITDNVHFTGMTMVTHSIKEAGVYSSGMPFQKNRDWLRNAVRYKQLDKLTKTIKSLIKAQKES